MPTLQNLPLGAYVVHAGFAGAKAAFALGDGSVRLADGTVAEPVDVHSGAVLCAVAGGDGRSLITGGDDGLVARVGEDGTVEKLAQRPRKWITQVAAGPQGAVAFASGRQVTVRLGDGQERVFEEERSAEGLAFAPKGMRLAIARYNGVTLRWITTEAPPAALEWKGAHTGVTFSPDGRFVVTTMQENALHGWRLAESLHLRMSGYPAKPRSVSWSAKGKHLATSGSEAAIVWPFHFKEGPQNKEPLQLGARKAMVTRVACHPRQETVAIGYQDGAVALVGFDGEGGVYREAAGSPVSALGWDAAGTVLAFGCEDGEAGLIAL